MVTVMIGAVLLGIFALVYTQKLRNRANISMLADLLAFREQIMTYYSSVVTNRNSWECTMRANSAMKTYLDTGTGTGGNLEIRDYQGNCQEGFFLPGGGGGGRSSSLLAAA